MGFEFSVITESLPALLAGAKLTWIITILGIVGGMACGILAYFFRSCKVMKCFIFTNLNFFTKAHDTF